MTACFRSGRFWRKQILTNTERIESAASRKKKRGKCMDSILYNQGDIVIRQGERENWMFQILSGSIGVYKDYGTENERKLAELGAGDFIGEMELIEDTPRSASGVVISGEAELKQYSDDNYLELIEKNPVQIYLMMKQLTERLRKTTQDYTEACKTIHEVLETASSHEKPKPELLEAVQKFSGIYQEMSQT